MTVTELAPDLILHSGQIYTMDAQNSVVDAVAVRDGRILTTGGTAQLRALAGTQTQQIDLGGQTVLPGIFDSHNHLLQVGIKLTRIRLDECQSLAEMMELVRARARETPPGHWIIGEGWSEHNFPANQLPTRHDIDPATHQHPVILMRFFNMDVVNSVALRLAGVDRSTPDPTGGRIERDPDGSPNGILRAAAKLLVRSLMPQPTLPELKQALALGCQEMNRYGITSVIDPGLYPYEMHAYQSFYQAGGLTVRMNLMPSWHGFREDEREAELDQRATGLGIYSGLGDE